MYSDLIDFTQLIIDPLPTTSIQVQLANAISIAVYKITVIGVKTKKIERLSTKLTKNIFLLIFE